MICSQPHQEHRAGHQGHDGGQAEAETRVDHQALRAFQCQGDAERLEDGKADGADARVLCDLPLASLAFLLHLLERGQDVAHKLHDDGSRDVGHDPQREHGEARQRPPENMLNRFRIPPCWPLKSCASWSGLMPGTGI